MRDPVRIKWLTPAAPLTLVPPPTPEETDAEVARLVLEAYGKHAEIEPGSIRNNGDGTFSATVHLPLRVATSGLPVEGDET